MAGPKQSYDRFIDWYLQGPYSGFTQSSADDLNLGISALVAAQPRGHFPDPPIGDLVIGQNTGWDDAPSRIDNGLLEHCSRMTPGEIVIAPPDSASDISIDKPHKMRVVGLQTDRLGNLLQLKNAQITEELAPLFEKTWRNHRLNLALDVVFGSMSTGAFEDRLLVDGAILLIVGELRKQARLERAAPVGLSERDARRIRDYIHYNLGEPLETGRLAAVIDKTPEAFHRAFRDWFGVSPAQFVLNARIERACDLLAWSPEPIAGIACACGFSSQQHMTNTFTAKLGVSPGRYRRNVKK